MLSTNWRAVFSYRVQALADPNIYKKGEWIQSRRNGVPCYMYYFPLIFLAFYLIQKGSIFPEIIPMYDSLYLVFVLRLSPRDNRSPEMTNKNEILLRRWHKNSDNLFRSIGASLWPGNIAFCNYHSIWPHVEIIELHVLQCL